ncbi:ABC transporter substrate-binding protein [Reinekea sp. G2M2-21]|uniref:ABC transporter substrate-binding protein n=1 Tax=Reinekea sp. G2M2-21 TaxID=2788942 RepID=UPI001E524F71|nr:ABC transporter substrate-binding protein [Reinekea sp. G2M2-21]
MIKKSMLCLSISVTLVAGAATVQADELRFSWWGGNSRHEATNAAVDAYEAATNSVVKTEYTGWGGHLERLTTQIAGKTEPDLMQTNWNWLPIFSPKGTGFRDLRDFSSQLDLSNFDESALALGTINGKLNSLPVSMAARIFYYNKDTWAAAGLDYPGTWDELMAAGPVFKEKLGDEYYPLVLEGRDVMAMNRSYMVQKYGIPMIDESKRSFAYSEDQMVEFFTLYADMIKNHVAPSQKYISSYGAANLYEHKPWINGEWAGLYMWNSAINKYGDNLKPPMTMALGSYPIMDGAESSGIFYKPGLMFSISKNSEQPEEAARLLNFLLNEKAGIEIMGLQRSVPLNSYAREVLAANGTLNSSDLTVAGLVQINQLVKKIPTSGYFENPQLVSLFQENIEQIDHGQKTVEEAAKDFYKQGQRILRKAIKD